MTKVKYISVADAADSWVLSERSVRNYCAQGRVAGAVQKGGTWEIPENAEKPGRKKRHIATKANLLTVLKREKEAQYKGGIYHKIQVDFTYNSNHIEGSCLSHEQTWFIFETKTLGTTKNAVRVDDIVETVNHFRCVDLVIEKANAKLSESLIKQLHAILKTGTSDAKNTWFKVGDYKMVQNEVGGMETTQPAKVKEEMSALLAKYNSKTDITLDDILDFHVRFEAIHPFQDGNGRIGRLLMLKECLKHNIVPFVITEELKYYYYRGLANWKTAPGYLRDTCLTAQDSMKKTFDYFGITYK